MRPNDSKLQMKEKFSGRTARQPTYQTQPTGAAAAAETVDLVWACTATTGAVA